MSATEIRTLAERASITPASSLLDLCCGIGGPGRFITKEFGNHYLGLDYSPDAISLARARATDLPCRFEVAHIPPIPQGPFDVVLLLETILAFPDKASLLQEIAAALGPGGRFACTVEAGAPLTESEQREMPDADTVHLIPLDDLLATLEEVGIRVRWQEDWTEPHASTAESLTNSFTAEAPAIRAEIGARALGELLAAHRLWIDWLRSGRVHKVALVAESG